MRRYKLTTLLCVLLTAILGGIAISRFAQIETPPLLFIFLSLVSIVAIKNRRSTAVIALLLLGFSIGLWRGAVFLPRITPYTELDGQKVTVRATADSSGSYGKNSQLEFDASDITFLEPYEVKVPGRMVLSGFGENSVLRGDVVTVSGKMYLRRGGKQAGISYGKIKVISRSASQLEKVRREFLAGLNTALPESSNQFAAGILIGQRSDMPESVSNTLRIVGLSHVIAVSGYNLTIMAEVVRRRMGKKSRYRNTLVSVGLILLFVAVAGSSASIARAAFVSLLTVIAAHYGRSVKPLLLILLAAAYTALMNPLNIWVDIGWYLSFLAFFGVLILAPAIQRRIYSKREPRSVMKLLIETSSAQLMTLPIVMYIFGEVSLISLVANLVVVPLVPLAMLLSVVAGFAGMIAPFYAGLLAWPAKILLYFMLSISSLLARIPHAFSQIKITSGLMIFMYMSIVMIVIILRKKSPKYGKITVE